MRLLHTKLLRFEEFFDSQIPKYAILSHRWGEKEVSFQGFEVGKEQAWPGFVKIRNCCSLAESRGFDWVWIDTCCIDKKSSAELSEAINSMFRWYAEAGECYVSLSDVQWNQGLDLETSFVHSSWFTRGWTLQELLAPSNVMFFDCDWIYIGNKNQLLKEISTATRIGIQYLDNRNKASVATKMSWISRRQTSRMEDIAYCLLGLFDVNMPLLYGEGRKAFLRLELEIIKKSDDESIFAWTSTSVCTSGLLALWPDAFVDAANIGESIIPTVERPPYSMTNKGLEFTVPQPQRGLPLIRLNCLKDDPNGYLAVMIKLAKIGRTWRRVECGTLFFRKPGEIRSSALRASEKQMMYIPQDGL